MSHRVIMLISPGIDSPVAAHLLSQKGAEVILLHLDNSTFLSDDPIEITDELAVRLKGLHDNIQMFRAPFGKIQQDIQTNVDEHFRCIICRRMMYRAAAGLAEEIDADAVATGESLGQVASQTLSNLTSEEDAVDIPIFRPLIGLDKEEIVEIAKKIGTYEISIRSSFTCGLIPSGPRISSGTREARKVEKPLDVRELLDEIEFSRVRI